ncbi:MAG: methyltransferase domain-containing protein [Armatimonadota bacterium]
MLAEELLAVMCCPVCGGTPLDLVVDRLADETIAEGSLGCPGCKRWYHVFDDIPSLMPQQLASSLKAADESWTKWRLAMGEFLSWRDEAWADPEQARQRRENAAAMHGRFLQFCELPASRHLCLDIGAGTGHLADLLAAECVYIGIDPLPGGRNPDRSEGPQHLPRPARPVSLVQGVAEELPFIDDAFDVALIVGSLDHCNDPERALAEACRVLKLGGTLGVLLGVAEARPEGGIGAALRSLAAALSGGSKPDVRPTHTFSFTREQLQELVGRHFQVDAVTEESGRAFIRATVGPDVAAQ